MQVLQDEGKLCLAAVGAPFALADGAGRRIEEERAIVCLAIVVAGGAKAERTAQDEQGRGKRPVAVMDVDERRIKRREVRSPLKIGALERPQRGVEAEAAQADD